MVDSTVSNRQDHFILLWSNAKTESERGRERGHVQNALIMVYPFRI